MVLDRQQVLDFVRDRGGDVAEAAGLLPDPVELEEHAPLLERFGVNANDLLGNAGGSSVGL
jgi:hypothetical protein